MRQLHDFTTTPIDEPLTVTVVDDPAKNGANRRYALAGFDTRLNGAREEDDAVTDTTIYFSDLDSAPNEDTGILPEMLLSVLADRLRGLQQGPGSCVEFQTALAYVSSAQASLLQRQKRLAREVK